MFGWDGPTLTVDESAPAVARTWSQVKSSIAESIAKTGEGYYRYSRHYNDIGPIDTSGTLTAEELKAQFAMACVLASPITVRGPVPADVKTWLGNSMLMNVNNDKVGRQGHVVAERGGVLVVKKYLWGMNDANAAVAFYNPTDEAVGLAGLYLSDDAKNLTKAQCALIAATLPNPRKYSSKSPSAYMLKRQNRILREMQYVGSFPAKK